MTEKKFCMSNLYATFMRKKYELIFNFAAMVLGILIAFQLEGWRKQDSLNKHTTVRLHMMYLEAKYNLTSGEKLFEYYSDAELVKILFVKLDDQSARAAYQDGNINHLLLLHQVSLIKTYVDAISALNYLNEKYISYLGTVDYKVTQDGKNYRMLINDTTAQFLAICNILVENFDEFFDKKDYSPQEFEDLRKKIKELKEDILKGQFDFDK